MPCQYSLPARLKLDEKENENKQKSKRSMWFFHIIANYDKHIL